MSEFTEIIKEAFLGEEPYDPRPGRAQLEESIRKFEARERTLRYLLWFAVTFMTAVSIGSAWAFLTSEPDTSTKRLILYGVLFLFACQSIGWSKMFLFSSQKALSVMKELKRIQLMLAGSRD